MFELSDNAISTMMAVGMGHSRRYCSTGAGMTSLKDGDLQHSSALAQSPKGDIEPNHQSEINPKPDSQ